MILYAISFKFLNKRCKFPPFLFRYSSVCVNLSSIKNPKKYKCVIFKKKKSLQRSLPPGICSIFLLTFYLNAAAIPVSNSSEITGFYSQLENSPKNTTTTTFRICGNL